MDKTDERTGYFGLASGVMGTEEKRNVNKQLDLQEILEELMVYAGITPLAQIPNNNTWKMD